MSDAYDQGMIDLALEIAKEANIKVAVGCYAGLTGPTLETPSEYKYVRVIGADAVGMSTVPEVIVARHMEIPCFAISIITDLGVPGKIEKVSVRDVINVASRQEPKMTQIMTTLISRI
jgi:purine-nucleoside phosphorylase